MRGAQGHSPGASVKAKDTSPEHSLTLLLPDGQSVPQQKGRQAHVQGRSAPLRGGRCRDAPRGRPTRAVVH